LRQLARGQRAQRFELARDVGQRAPRVRADVASDAVRMLRPFIRRRRAASAWTFWCRGRQAQRGARESPIAIPRDPSETHRSQTTSSHDRTRSSRINGAGRRRHAFWRVTASRGDDLMLAKAEVVRMVMAAASATGGCDRILGIEDVSPAADASDSLVDASDGGGPVAVAIAEGGATATLGQSGQPFFDPCANGQVLTGFDGSTG